jgi:hypothetical protein
VIYDTQSVRPLILLDVDGVINDTPSVFGLERPCIPMGKPAIHIPNHVLPLLEYLGLIGEIWWRTTRTEIANLLPSDLVGVGPYPMIGVDSERVDPPWKTRSAPPIVTRALGADRTVYWIKDFEGHMPTDVMPSAVVFIDTAAEG